MTRADRLNDAFNYLRFRGLVKTQKDVAEAMGATPPNVSSALKGDEKFLTDSFIIRFTDVFKEVSSHWLLTGEGEMLNVCGDRNIVGNSAGRDLNITQGDSEEDKKRDDMSIDAFARRLLDMQENLQKQLVALGEAVNSKDEQINKLLSIIDKLTDKQ